MTLLFYLRSSNGSTAPGPYQWDLEEVGGPRRRRIKGKHLTIEEIHHNRMVRRKEENDLLLMLFLRDLDEFDS